MNLKKFESAATMKKNEALPLCHGNFSTGKAEKRACSLCPFRGSCIGLILKEDEERGAKKFDQKKPRISLVCLKMAMAILESVPHPTWLGEVFGSLVKAAHAETVTDLEKFIKKALLAAIAEKGQWQTMELAAAAMEHGIGKYGRNNWKKGMEWSRPLDAALRHFFAAALGEEIDRDSKLPHVANGLASINMLLGHIEYEIGMNDLFDPDEKMQITE